MSADTGPRILLVGNGPLALALLEGLLSSKSCVVTGVLRWSSTTGGRRDTDAANRALRALIRRHGPADIRCASVNSTAFTRILERQQPDCVLVGSWGEILLPHILRHTTIHFVNCHPSLLPAHRGANPYASTIRSGECETGVSFHVIAAAVDAGPLLFQRRVPIRDSDTGGDLRARCAAVAREMVPEFIERLRERPLTTVDQNVLGEASCYPALTRSDGAIDWHLPAAEIHSRIRALQPWVASYTFFRDAPRWQLIATASELRRVEAPGITPGTVIACDGRVIWVVTGNADVQIGLRDPYIGRDSWRMPICLSHLLRARLLRPGRVLASC